MTFFACSMSNEGRGRPVVLLTDNVGQVEKFVEDHDQPGRSVYAAVNPLRPGAKRRSREDVAGIVTLHVDIDFKRLSTPPDEVRAKVHSLPLPLEIRESGGGLHVLANLKEAYENGTEHYQRAEALRTQLTELLCGDPAPNHSAAILRVVGSHNSKYGEPVEVRVVAVGEAVDLTDVEAFFDLYSRPLFEVKEEYTRSFSTDNVVDFDAPARPIDYDAVLADMPATGEGVNAVSHRLLRALILREGMTPDEAVERVVDAVMDMVTRHSPVTSDGHSWTREDEVRATVPRMTWVLNRLQADHWKAVDAGHMSADTPPAWLWGDVLRPWGDVCAEGLRPQITRNGSGWYVRRPHGSAKAAEAERDEPGGDSRAEAPRGPAPRFVLRCRGLIVPERIPTRKWLGGGEFFQRRTVSVTFAPGDYGKTTLGMTEGIAMLTGRDLLGEQPDEKLRIWIHNGEDSRDELDRRIAATCLFNKIPLTEVADIIVTTATDVPLRVASGYGEVVLDKSLIKCIHEQIGDNKIDVAMFDPLITLHGVPEGDNSKMDRVIRVFTEVADAQNCAIHLSQHVRKGPAGEEYEFTVDDGRGASAIRDAARAVRVLNRIPEKLALDLGIPLHERPSYLRIDRAKGNNSRVREPRWVKFTNVDLPQGDAVGVLTAWAIPEQDSAQAAEANEKADAVFLTILRRFNDEGRRASDRKGMNFAPKLFAREREAKQAKLGPGALEKAMRRLLDDYRIKMVDDGGGGRVVHELQIV